MLQSVRASQVGAAIASLGKRQPSRHFGLARNLKLKTGVSSQRDRKTKIVATIGPASVGIVPQLVSSLSFACFSRLAGSSSTHFLNTPFQIAAGVNVARINCSHGNPEYYQNAVSAVRGAVEDFRSYVATALTIAR